MYMDKNSPVSILNEIARSRQVVSISLHGIIAAEALGSQQYFFEKAETTSLCSSTLTTTLEVGEPKTT